ncbi:MAG: penicillin acylase family protein [Bacteroidota bacterium]
MRWVKFLVSLLLTLGLLFLLERPPLPVNFSLGTFFNPQQGFWQNAEPVEGNWADSLDIPGLKSPVKLVVDERGVPHIFAQSMTDAAAVQGYVTARDRLWQMEFQIMAAAGRLTEIVGEGPGGRVLEIDRTARRKGLAWAAERSCEYVMQHPETGPILEAYARGINAWIDQLDPSQYPIEYKLLGYAPAKWEPLNTCLLVKQMANTLASRASDIDYTHALKVWGRETFDLLYPEYSYDNDPIVPANTRWNRRIASPQPPVPQDYHPDSLLEMNAVLEQPDKNNGSNNWVVAGKRSETGYPLLASDPHLGLTLPSIWYEVQLSIPGSNMYGVSIPGSPGIPIGFNDSIAWGETNAGKDVMDFYQLEIRHDPRPQYRYGDGWKNLTLKEEVHTLKGGGQFVDSVWYTDYGPVMFDENFQQQEQPLAVRWIVHEPSNEVLAFLRLSTGKNYEDYTSALSYYASPAQNFAFASADGDIAIWQQGKYVNRWKEQGKFVMDGADPEQAWQGFIPQEQNPHALNPPEGYLASANQRVTSAQYPYYYTGRFDPYRGRRINDLLGTGDTIGVKQMQQYQLDNFSVLAADLLPTLLGDLDSTLFSEAEREVYDILKGWNYMYDRESVAPTLFNSWWRNVFVGIWRDEFDKVEESMSLTYPQSSTTVRILRDSVRFRFYKHEEERWQGDRQAVVQKTFTNMVSQLVDNYPNREDWLWAKRKTTDINHLSRSLAAFSRQGLPTSGNGGILNATGRTHGPSWRMVVALGPELKGYGVYPGGQSGNPGSPLYDNFVDDWVEGNYYTLWFMKTANEQRENKPSSSVYIRPKSE